MKKNLLTLGAVAASLVATAGPVSPQRAATVAGHFWQHTLHAPASTLLADRSSEWAYDGIYLFAAKHGGFVMVSADDATQPILAYSATSTLDPTRLPVQLDEWLQTFQQQVDLARKALLQPDSATRLQWKCLESGLPLPKTLGNAVPPLLSTLWDQDAPYNNLCPEGTVTGCAATAQAQLMKYYNFPAFGLGNHSYLHNRFGTLGADFGHTVYDWDYMPDSADARNDNERQQLAVATLMYHVGVSLDMQYNTPQGGGSAAAGLAGFPGYASMDNSLKDYFHYNPLMRVITKSQGYSDSTWRDALIAELDLRQPILYTGASAQGGHGFLCDGYDSLGMMHFNFGWSGIGNGYYAVGSITPGIGPNGSLGQYDFSSTNQALLGATPVYAMRLSDTVKAFVREGGTDSLLFCIDPTLPDPTWTTSTDAEWLTVQHDGFARVGWIRIAAEANTSGHQRTATVTFSQGGRTATLRVVQDHYGEDDYCPLTVVMESRRGNGWVGGAHLTLESEGGLVYGTAQLAGGSLDSITIPVPPQTLRVVWHSGGGTDRFANYTLKDLLGNVLLDVENAYLNDNHHVLADPCGSVGIGEGQAWNLSLYPNPSHSFTTVEAPGLKRVEVMDLTGRVVLRRDTAGRLELDALAPGIYMVRIVSDSGTAVRRLAVE